MLFFQRLNKKDLNYNNVCLVICSAASKCREGGTTLEVGATHESGTTHEGAFVNSGQCVNRFRDRHADNEGSDVVVTDGVDRQ